jgi:hypothetical protein
MATIFGKWVAPRREIDPNAKDYAVPTGKYDKELPFTSRYLYVGAAGDVRLWLWASDAVASSGTLTISGGSGTVGGVIAGTTVTVTWGTSDIATATALAAAINANGTIGGGKVVNATNLIGGDSNGQGAIATNVVTVSYFNPSPAGNSVTLVASGTGVTASGATLSGASGTTLYKGMLKGTMYPLVIREIIASGTTATDLVITR